MADTFLVFQFKVLDRVESSATPVVSGLVTEEFKERIRRIWNDNPVVEVVDAFTDTAETTISEV